MQIHNKRMGGADCGDTIDGVAWWQPKTKLGSAVTSQLSGVTMSPHRLPENTSLVMPRLVCRDVAAEMDFCIQTFDAEDLNRRPGPDGKVVHGLLRISGEMVMIEGDWPSLPSRPPLLDASSPVVIFVYVPDVDATVARAVANGAKVLVPLQDQFWGDRIAWFSDPAGHVWTVASRIEDTTASERTARWDKILTGDH